MRVLDMIADERRRVADLLAGLSAEQLRSPSLCAEWTVHDIGAHLLSFLSHGRAKLYLGMLATGADLDRVNRVLTRRAARRPTQQVIDLLRRRADSAFSVPGSGHDPVLAEVVLHGLDIRVPLGIAGVSCEQRLRLAFVHLTTVPVVGFGVGRRLDGLRLLTTDTGWAHGTGAQVRGPAEAVLLAIAGRAAALDALAGDGVPILRQRLADQPRPTARQRLAATLAQLSGPPHRASPTRDIGR